MERGADGARSPALLGGCSAAAVCPRGGAPINVCLATDEDGYKSVFIRVYLWLSFTLQLQTLPDF